VILVCSLLHTTQFSQAGAKLDLRIFAHATCSHLD